MITPAMIDSQGNPGIGGSASGVVAELDVLVVVGVFTIGVTVLTAELVEVELVVLVVLTVLTIEELVLVDVELVVLVSGGGMTTVVLEVVDPPPPPPPPPPVGGLGGSRWNTPANGVGAPFMPAPTANPSVGEVK